MSFSMASPVRTMPNGAQAYTARPVTMLVPYEAGGPLDAIARIMVERMRTSLGQPIVIENATGAGGMIGVIHVVRTTPDGSTASFGNWLPIRWWVSGRVVQPRSP